MVKVEKLPVIGDIDTVLKPLEIRIHQCDSLRVSLIQILQNPQDVPLHGQVDVAKLQQFLIDFEVKAINPARLYVENVRAGKKDRNDIHLVLTSLDTWITEIEKVWPINWGENVANAAVLPFRRKR